MSRRDEYDVSPTDEDALGDDEPEARDNADPEEKVTEIRESIEQTRAEMSETIGELQERLSPSYLKQQVKEQVMEQFEQAKETVREATIGKMEDVAERVGDTLYETRMSVVETIKANPIPAALAGIGLAWLWMNRSAGSAGSRDGHRYRGAPRYDETPRRYTSAVASSSAQRNRVDERWNRTTGGNGNLLGKAGDTVSEVADQVQEKASKLADKAKEKVSGVVDQAQQTAEQLANEAQYRARLVEDRFNTAMRENPLAIGAIALALGTAVGLAVPQTRKENEWMGEARDTLVDKAQAVAHDTLEQVQEVAQKVTDEMAATDYESSRAPEDGSRCFAGWVVHLTAPIHPAA